MPRRFFNDGQEVVFEDFNAISQALQRELYDRFIYRLLQDTDDAFFADSFLVEYATASSVTVRAGSGLQDDSSQSNPEPTKRVLHKASQTTHNIESPDGSLDRIDIVVTQAALANDITVTRKYKSAGGTISDQSMVVQKDWESTIDIVEGTPAGSPSAPGTPA
jgi:hypothetical protein